MEAQTNSIDPADMPSTAGASEQSDETDEDSISKDEMFHVLQNERRRRVLAYLTNRDGPFEMRSIAEQVAAWEHDTTVRQLMSDERQRVYIALYQSHLPKLDEVGLIEYEQSRGVVEKTPLLENVSQYVEPPEPDAPDSEHQEEIDAPSDPAEEPEAESKHTVEEEHVFMSVAVFSFLLTAGVWLHSIPASILSGVQAAMVVTGLFLLTTTGILWNRRDR